MVAGGKPWWRLYETVAHDPKLMNLSHTDRWRWIEACCLTCATGGQPWGQLALNAYSTTRRDLVNASLTRLRLAGLIDEVSPGRFLPHNWNGRQFSIAPSTERTRKWRHKRRHGNAPRAEQSRTEQKEGGVGEGDASPAARPARKLATRLPSDWQPSETDLAYARRRNLSGQVLDDEIEKFRNHWTAKGGRDAAKHDWAATWRNWVITAGRGRPQRQPQAQLFETPALTEDQRKVLADSTARAVERERLRKAKANGEA